MTTFSMHTCIIYVTYLGLCAGSRLSILLTKSHKSGAKLLLPLLLPSALSLLYDVDVNNGGGPSCIANTTAQ
jgi:hypothetical protein